MQRFIFLGFISLVISGSAAAQDSKKEMLTLSQGKYVEVFDQDSIEHVGNILYNINTQEIIGFADDQETTAAAMMQPEVISRWLSIDPLAAKFPNQSPYAFAGNNPVYYVDIDGLYQYPAGEAKKYADKYPAFTAYLSQNVNRDVMRSPTILAGFEKYSGGNLTRSEANKATTWKSGPTVKIVDDPGFNGGANGRYDDKTNTIFLNKKLVEQFENASPEDKQAALYGAYETLMHETVHFGDYLDGSRQEPEDPSGFGGEPGTAFSQDVFYTEFVNSDGQKVPVIDPGLDHTNIDDAKKMMENNKRDGKGDIIPTVPKTPQ